MTALPDPVTIRALAVGGDGVGTLPDGRTIFVPRTAPGDRLTVRQLEYHTRFARGHIDTLLDPGPDRVEPVCPHYQRDRCGGCQLMHLDVSAQTAHKARMAGDALRRIGRLTIEDPAIVPPTAPLGYRTRIALAIRDGRVGYHRYDAPGQVFDLERCLLVEEEVDRLLQAVLRMRRQFAPWHDRLLLRRDQAGHAHLVLEGGPGTGRWSGGAAIQARLGAGVTVWERRRPGRPRRVVGAGEHVAATVFEQVNPPMAALVRDEALAGAGDVAGRLVWDLYAGMGETTRRLAELGAQVESVEWDREAVALAEALGPTGPRRLARDVAEALPLLTAPAVVLTNPPRTGMAAPVCDALAASAAERIVYVSCDPATLARDIRRLGPRWQVSSVRAFDQFPQTAHLELVAVLTPTGAVAPAD